MRGFREEDRIGLWALGGANDERRAAVGAALNRPYVALPFPKLRTTTSIGFVLHYMLWPRRCSVHAIDFVKEGV